MKKFSRFEATMARIVTGLVGPGAIEDILPMLVREHEQPSCLSRDFVAWLQDALGKACTQRLAREGWRNEPRQTAEGPRQGRLWDCYLPGSMPLHFSRNTLLLIQWLTATNAAQSKASGRVRVESMTTGDHLLNLMIFDRLQYAPLVQLNLAGKPAFKANALIPLVFPDGAIVDPAAEINFTPWFKTDQIWILEALQSWLCRRWIECEQEQRLLGSPADLRRRGQVQVAVLSAFLEAAAEADRRDLALFTVAAAGEVIRSRMELDGSWFKHLNLQGLKMSERSDTYRAALALFHSMVTLGKWQQEARTVSFYDDEYAASQFWLGRWDDLSGDEVVSRAADIIRAESPAASIG